MKMVPTELAEELERLHPASWAWSLVCCRGRRVEAEEVLQSVYLKIWEGRATYRGRSSLKTWLFAVIRRTAADHGRREATRRWLLVRWFRERPGRDPDDGPERRLSESEDRRRVRRALASLSHRQRQVLELVFYHDLTVDEAARVLGIGVGSARVHYDRGKRRVLEVLERERLDGASER